MDKRLLWVLLSLYFAQAHTAKILVVSPSLADSMVYLSGRIADVLINGGHDVVMWIPEVKPSSANGTKQARIIRMHNISDSFMRAMQQYGDLFDEDNVSIYSTQTRESNALADVCEGILRRKEEMDALRSYKFDIIITNMIDLCDVGLAHYIGAKSHFWVATGPLHEVNTAYLGVPSPLSYVPVLENNPMTPLMSFSDRLLNFYRYWITYFVRLRHLNRINEIFRKYVSPTFPDVGALASHATLCFVNSDEFVDVARPILHKTIYIGGVGISRNPKDLPPEVAQIMEKGKLGVVFMSLGTAAPTTQISASKKKILFDVFESFQEYHFVVKVSAEDFVSHTLAENRANIELVKWFPQSDVLGHPRLKLFISHGGYNSILESAIRGVPLVIFPLFFDQFRNAKTVEYRGYGRIADRTKLSYESLHETLSDVLTTKGYKQKAMETSRLIANKPFGPDEVLLKWTNFVAENGNLPQLTPEGVHLNFFVYNSLDIILFLCVSLTLSLYLFYLFCRLAYFVVLHFDGKVKID